MLENSQIVNLHLSLVVQQNCVCPVPFYLISSSGTHSCKSYYRVDVFIHSVKFYFYRKWSGWSLVHSTTVVLLYIRFDERTRQKFLSHF